VVTAAMFPAVPQRNLIGSTKRSDAPHLTVPS
jgi:hypothetical protein